MPTHRGMKRGGIWQADLGYSGKIRPVLALSIAHTDHERAIATYVPRTTSEWEGRYPQPTQFPGNGFAVRRVWISWGV
jgi:mRNA-degrading endonuclease toxin of MazEF toxin-antitoxin module